MKYSSLIFYILPVFMLCGCSDTWLDSMWIRNVDLENKVEENTDRIEGLEDIVSRTNTDISSLQALVQAVNDSDFITEVRDFSENGRTGCMVSFHSGKSIRIYDGTDGLGCPMPEIGIREDADGRYCWTVGGEWLTGGDGGRIYCEGLDATVPEVRITDGYWEISYDGGSTWTNIGKADGDDNDIFESIEATDSKVVFTLSDGTSFSLPFYVFIEFDIEGDETGVEARKEISVNYTVFNATENTLVTAASDGNYRVRVERKSISEGTIIITSPKFYEDGHISVSVYDENGYSKTRVINFYEREIYFPNGLEYRIPARGTTLAIPLSANFDYNIEIPSAPWLTWQSRTKAEMQDRSITVTAEMNNEFTERTGIIELIALNNPDEPQSEITVIQSAADFSVDRKRFVLTHEDQPFSCTVRTSLDIEVSDAAEDWLSYSLGRQEENVFVLNGRVQSNTGAGRETVIRISNSRTGSLLDEIEIVQLQDGAENPDDMIFTVRANQANDYTVYLPLSGAVDCIVDWGDGSVERVTSVMPSHLYNVSSAADFTVRISGTVTSLSSNNIPAPAITEVVQWGRTGLNSMSNAFVRNNLLTSIPPDENGSFSEVTDFTGTFEDCRNLAEIPARLFRFCGKTISFQNTFSKCHSLTSIPADMFEGCYSVTTFSGLFSGCRDLRKIPEDLFEDCPDVENYDLLFENCTSISEIPAGLFRNSPKVRRCYAVFRNTGITAVPAGLFDKFRYVITYASAFESCIRLVYVPVDLFSNSNMVQEFNSAFSGCASLTCESPYSVIEGEKCHIYERGKYFDYFVNPPIFSGCFSGCGNLSDFSEIPDNWK